jgi:hypothetical protein
VFEVGLEVGRYEVNHGHDLTYWRDKRLFTWTSHDVHSFKLTSSKGGVAGTRDGDQWTIQAPANPDPVRGDTESIDALISGITFLSAKAFIDPAALAGQKQISSLELRKAPKEKASPETVTIQVYASTKQVAGKPEKVFARVSNLAPAFELDPATKDRLEKSFSDLRMAKLITSMERFTAKRLEFSGPAFKESGKLTLAQKDGKWINVSAGAKPELNAEKVQTLMDRVGGNRIQEFVLGRAIPAGAGDGVFMALWDDKDPEGKSPAVRQLVFWKSGGKLYARDTLSTRQEAFVVDPLIGEALPWNKDALAPVPGAAPSAVPPAKTSPAKP